MPARKIYRSIRGAQGPSIVPLVSGDSASTKYSPLGTNTNITPPAAPKHIPFNCSIVDSPWLFETRMFLYTILGAFGQFLHIYHSVWWLPYTANNYPISYHLMDPLVTEFLIIVLARRLVYCVISIVLEMWLPTQILNIVLKSFRTSATLILLAITCIYSTTVYHGYSAVNIMYLCYPFTVYLIFFGFKTGPIFETVLNPNGLPPLHACTNEPHDIRAEVEELKKNFNSRFKQILFNSVVNAYYCGLLPCCFVHLFAHYDINWAAQHIGVIWFGSFTAYTVQALPIRYWDTLHRSALHLGYWDKLEPGAHANVVHQWNENVLWPFGTVVQNGKEWYRSLGEVNVAEPGNMGFSRFYSVFWNPPLPFSVLLVSQAGLVLFQLICLIRSYACWYNMISTSLLLVFNYYTLYLIGRNFFVCQRLYNLEQAMHEKAAN